MDLYLERFHCAEFSISTAQHNHSMSDSNQPSNDRFVDPRKGTISLLACDDAEPSRSPGLDVHRRSVSPPPKARSISFVVLKDHVARFRSGTPPAELPTLEQITAEASNATGTEIYTAISLCATHICDAAWSHIPEEPSGETSEEQELAEKLLRKWKKLQQRNDTLVASVPKEQLIEIFHEILGEMNALKKRESPLKKESKVPDLVKRLSRRLSRRQKKEQ